MTKLLAETFDAAPLRGAARQGSVPAFERLSRGYDHPVLALALRVTASEQAARSIYCETFLRLHREVHSLSPDTLWVQVLRIASDLCLDHLRAVQRGNSGPAAAPSSGPVAFQRLSPRERLVLELRHYHGLRLHAVGEVLNVTEETAREIFSRATSRLH